MKNSGKLLILFIFILLTSGCTAIVNWQKRNEFQTNTVRQVTYNMPFKQLWPIVMAEFMGGHEVSFESESQGRIISQWVDRSTTQSKEVKEQLEVQILGREQPYRVTAVVHTNTREKDAKGNWGTPVTGQDEWGAVEFLTKIMST